RVRFCRDQGWASTGRRGIVRDIAKSEPEEVVVSNCLIHAELILLLILMEGCRIDSVVQAVQPRTGGWKGSLRELHHRLIDQTWRNPVSRERIACEGSGYRPRP